MKTTHEDDARIYEELGGVLTALRPTTVTLDPEWSTQTLETILAGPAPAKRPARKRRIVVAGVAFGIVATGGAAYATGNTPAFIDHVISDMTGSDSAAAHMQQIADLKLPDGSRFAAWRGLTDKGLSCNASAENWNGKELTSGHGVSCGKIDPKDPDGDNFRVEWPVGKDWDAPGDKVTRYRVAYGQIGDPKVVSVHATGDATDVVMTVDRSSRGFAAVLPGVSHLPSEDSPRATLVKLEFRDADGNIVRTVRVLG